VTPQVNNPRGRIAQSAGLLRPLSVTASKLALERAWRQRMQRLASTTIDVIHQRVRPTRERMRSLTVGPGGDIRYRDVPVPPAAEGLTAVVRPLAVATCDMDRPLALGVSPFPLPLQIGHECVAEIVSIGDQVETVRIGDRVVVPFQINCGTCSACDSGLTANCLGVPPMSMYGFGLGGGHWGGAVSDLLAVPFADAMLVPVPPELSSSAVASVADTATDGYRHVGLHLPRLLDRDRDAKVLIVGAVNPASRFSASCALFAAQVARAFDARTVTLADARPHVRKHAERLGLEAFEPKSLQRASASLVVDSSASAAGLALALASTAPDGVCSSAGGLYNRARIPAGLLYGRNVELHIGRSHARAYMPDVLTLMTAGKIRPELVTTCEANFDDAEAAYRDHVRGQGTKMVLVADHPSA
jgi:alcohol dehydrogenase